MKAAFATMLILASACAATVPEVRRAAPAMVPAPAPASQPVAPVAPIPPPIAPVRGDVKIIAVGDVMLGSTYPDATGKALPPDDGAHLLDEVAPLLHSGDLTFGNLEGPLVDDGVSGKCGKRQTKKCYAFRVPTRYGALLKAAGFTVMGLANNHALDFGEEGRASSLHTLDALGILHSGPVGDVAHVVIHGERVALIAFTTYSHSHDLNQLDAALAVIRDEASHNDLVIVTFHGGAEGETHQHVPAGAEMFYDENRGDLRAFAHAAVDAGAALVFGHGPHVVRGMEVYKDHLIAYSLGNFATYGGINVNGAAGVTLVLEVELGAGGTFVGGRVYPVKQLHPGGPHLDATGAVIPLLEQLSRDDFGAAAAVIGADGEIRLH